MIYKVFTYYYNYLNKKKIDLITKIIIDIIN